MPLPAKPAFVYHPAKGWGKPKAKKPTANINADTIIGVCWHIIAAGRLKDHSGKTRLKAITRNHRSKGWSDIAYAMAVDPYGEIWEAQGIGKRGFAEGKSRSGTNQTIFHNPHWISCVFLSGTDNEISRNAKAAILAVTDYFLQLKPNLQVRGHREVKYDKTYGDLKSCPGDNVINLLNELYPTRLEGCHKPVDSPKRNVQSKWWLQDAFYLKGVELGIMDGSRADAPATRAEALVMAMRTHAHLK